MPKKGSFKDISGARYGKLIPIQVVGKANSGNAIWLCRCDCGKEHSVRQSNLQSGGIKSCGCDRWTRLYRHGLKDHELYKTWKVMRARCNNPNVKDYRLYGARGIKVCERWDDFACFLADVGERPPGLTLDRIDSNGDYEPENVRWATWGQQRNNRRPRSEWVTTRK